MTKPVTKVLYPGGYVVGRTAENCVGIRVSSAFNGFGTVWEVQAVDDGGIPLLLLRRAFRTMSRALDEVALLDLRKFSLDEWNCIQ